MTTTIICCHNGEITVSSKIVGPWKYPFGAYVYRHIPSAYQKAYVYRIDINYANAPVYQIVHRDSDLPPELKMVLLLLDLPNPETD